MKTRLKVETLQKWNNVCIIKKFRGWYPQSCATYLHLLNFLDPRPPQFSNPDSRPPIYQTRLTRLIISVRVEFLAKVSHRSCKRSYYSWRSRRGPWMLAPPTTHFRIISHAVYEHLMHYHVHYTSSSSLPFYEQDSAQSGSVVLPIRDALQCASFIMETPGFSGSI